FGISILYLSLAFLMALALALVRFLPNTPLTQSVARGAAERNFKVNIPKVIFGLIACLLFYIGMISVWTFMGGFAESAAIAPDTTNLILAIATFIGIAGCLAATWVAGKFNRKASLIGGYTAMALSIGLLFGVDSVVFFGAAAVLLKIAWPWTLPFLMSTLADLDPLGRVTNLANLAIGGGTAIG